MCAMAQNTSEHQESAELRRTPCVRTSENPQNANFAITEFSEVQSRIMQRLPLRAARMASKRACTPRGVQRGPVVTEDGSCSARELSEPTQRPDAGNKEVVPPTVAHERGKPSQTSAD